MLDNINKDAAVPMDSTPQDFYIYFDDGNEFVLDTNNNIVIIWQNNATSNSNNTAGEMTTLVNHVNSILDENYKVYTYYPSNSPPNVRSNEMPIISFITR